MSVSTQHIVQLLSNTKRIIAHHRETEKLKGETFNIFSILGMEHYENNTHSALLGELLNPKGSHLKGSVFLQLFFDLLDITHIDIESAELILEYSVGTRDDENKQGGRIDIFIKDKNHCALAIENKIYAGDQYAQIERYCNYKKENYKVLYLTLDGSEPSIESKGELISGKDFYLLSYKEDILKWLKLCMKEATDTPILRETIKQYILLIKKLTLTMDNQAEKELMDIMFQYYEEASFITNNFNKARQSIAEEIRQLVYESLSEKISNIYDLEMGNPTTSTYSQIWFYLKEFSQSNLYFGLESFSGTGWHNGDLFIGVFNNGATKSKFGEQAGNSNTNKWWVDQHLIKEMGQVKINFSNADTLRRLHTDVQFKKEFTEHIVMQVIEYLNWKTPLLISFLQIK